MELLAADDHLASCEACYQRSGAEEKLASAVAFVQSDLRAAEIEEPDHLSHRQIVAYVNNELDEFALGSARLHLATCPECEALHQDLRRVHADIAFGKVYTPTEKPGLWSRLRDLWRKQTWRTPIKITGLLLATAALVWAVTFPLRNQLADLQARMDQLQRENASLRNEVTNISNLESRIEQLRIENARLQQMVLPEGAGKQTSQMLLALNDGGGRVMLDNQDGLTGLEFVSAADQQAVKKALWSQRAELPSSFSSLASRPGRLMGAGQNSFAVVSPVGIAVSTTQPTMRWKPLDGASGYAVTVYDRDHNEKAMSGMLYGTEWTPPPLTPGQIYSWQVRAIKDGKEVISPPPDAPDAKFMILDRAQIETLERAKRLYAKSHLTLGVLYARAGLLEDAANEFRALLNANPDSIVARNLLRSVTTGRR